MFLSLSFVMRWCGRWCKHFEVKNLSASCSTTDSIVFDTEHLRSEDCRVRTFFVRVLVYDKFPRPSSYFQTFFFVLSFAFMSLRSIFPSSPDDFLYQRNWTESMRGKSMVCIETKTTLGLENIKFWECTRFENVKKQGLDLLTNWTQKCNWAEKATTPEAQHLHEGKR